MTAVILDKFCLYKYSHDKFFSCRTMSWRNAEDGIILFLLGIKY